MRDHIFLLHYEGECETKDDEKAKIKNNERIYKYIRTTTTRITQTNNNNNSKIQ